jgi:hypothetical protein
MTSRLACCSTRRNPTCAACCHDVLKARLLGNNIPRDKIDIPNVDTGSGFYVDAVFPGQLGSAFDNVHEEWLRHTVRRP